MAKRSALTKEKREKILMRDNWTCVYCGKSLYKLGKLCKLYGSIHEGGNFYYQIYRNLPNEPEYQNLSEDYKLIELVHYTEYPCIDHKLPIVKGGTNKIGNLVTSCWKCNSIKGDLTAEEFIAMLGEVS